MRRTQLASGLSAAALAASLAGCGHGSTAAPSPVSALPQSSHTASVSTACRNADVPAPVKAALVQSDGRAGAIEVAGATFYGTCGTTQYAVTRMTLAPGADSLQSVAFTDGGAFPELLVDTGTSWRLVTRAATSSGCTDSAVLPSALRTIWQNCRVAASPSPTASLAPTQTASGEATCQQFYAGKVFLAAQAVTVESDGTAVLVGAPVTVHCGGPDDFQFVQQPGTTTVDLAAGAKIVVLDGTTQVPLAVSKLAAYVTGGMAATDVFELTGTRDGTRFDATAIAEQFHP